MSGLAHGWFYDDDKKLSSGLKVDKIVYEARTSYQHILIFENSVYGKVLVLDDTTQLTERDECAYHEMIAFLPLNSHRNPKKVLIIGGGDGGVARECAKFPSVQTIDICEIDQMVMDAARKFLPFTSVGLDHSKVKIHVRDGADFIKETQEKYDVIITDSSDLQTDSTVSDILFQKNYYECVKKILAPGGILCSQAMGMWVDEDVAKVLYKMCVGCFTSVAYAVCSVPSFLGGSNGFILCSESVNCFMEPLRDFTEKEMEDYQLKYYSPEVHKASFVLPRRFQNIFRAVPKLTHKTPSLDHGSK